MNLKLFKENGRLTAEVFTNDEEETQKLDEKFNIKSGLSYNIDRFLQKVASHHRKLYRIAGIDREKFQEYHQVDNNFNASCEGFQRFLSDHFGVARLDHLTNEKIEKLGDYISSLMRERLAVSEGFETTINILPQESQQTLKNPQIADQSLLVTNDQVYKLSIAKTKQETLSDIKNKIKDSFKESYKRQMEVAKKVYQEEMENLRSKQEKELKAIFFEGIKFSDKLGDKWEARENSLVYKGTIIPKKLKYNGKLYYLNKDVAESMRVEGLHMKIKPKIQTAYTDNEVRHPNIEMGSGKICLGDLNGKSLEKVAKGVVRLLKIVNMDSAWTGLNHYIDYEAVEEEGEFRYGNITEGEVEEW